MSERVIVYKYNLFFFPRRQNTGHYKTPFARSSAKLLQFSQMPRHGTKWRASTFHSGYSNQ